MLEETCPECGYKFDCATPVEGEPRPKPGDVSICLRCGATNVFTDEVGHVRKCTDEDIKRFEKVPMSWAMIKMAQDLIRQKATIQ